MTGKYTGAPNTNFYQMENHLSKPPVTMLEPCVKNAFCKNTPGTYECQCKEGYHGDHYSWCALSRCPPGMWGAGEWCQPIPEHGHCVTDECIDFDCPSSHPIKMPELHLYVRVLGYEGGAHMFADGSDVSTSIK